MLVPFSNEDAYSQQSSDASPHSLWLDELVASLHQYLCQRFGRRHQDSRLVEQPSVVDNAIILDRVDPLSLRFTAGFLKYLQPVPSQEVCVL